MTPAALLALALAPIAHMLGDYVLQSHVMAVRKTSSWAWATIHAAFYSIPFAVLLFALTGAPRAALALAVIGGTHAVIDRYRLAAYWCRWWGVGFPGVWASAVHAWWSFAHEDDYGRATAPEPTFEAPPPFLGVWLVILTDNTFHLCINAAALAWAVS